MYCQKCGKEIAKKTGKYPECGYEALDAKLRLKDIWRVTPVQGKNPDNSFPSDCVDCENCMNYCSNFHEGGAVPVLSRIQVDPKVFEWMMHETDELPLMKRTVCRQCPGVAPCMAACKISGAMSRDAKTGAVLINEAKCSKCRQCEKACPHGAIQYVKAVDKIFKCDLCGGKPECVGVCPVGALKYEKIA